MCVRVVAVCYKLTSVGYNIYMHLSGFGLCCVRRVARTSQQPGKQMNSRRFGSNFSPLRRKNCGGLQSNLGGRLGIRVAPLGFWERVSGTY